MNVNNTITPEQRFINDYYNNAIKRLHITDDNMKRKIRNLIEMRFIPTNLGIFNSETFQTTDIDAIKFFYGVRSKFILNENGVLFWKSGIKKSISAEIINQNIQIRQVFKKQKKEAAKRGDKIAEDTAGTFEALTKLMINGSTFHRAPKLGD